MPSAVFQAKSSGNGSLASQARLFSRYLINRLPSDHSIALYAQAIGVEPITDTKDQKLFDFIVKHPVFLPCIDAALPWRRPNSEVRRRLYVMLAILEASPENYDTFLPGKRHPLYAIVVGLSVIQAIILAAGGLVVMGIAE